MVPHSGPAIMDTSYVFLSFESVERSPPIEEVIKAGVVPRFVVFLQKVDFPQLQVQSQIPRFVWLVSELASCGIVGSLNYQDRQLHSRFAIILPWSLNYLRLWL